MDGLNNEQILEKYQNKIEKKGFFSFYFHPSYEVKYKVKILSKIIGLLKEKKEILTFTEIAEKWKDENTADL
jgi:hypothetical protein